MYTTVLSTKTFFRKDTMFGLRDDRKDMPALLLESNVLPSSNIPSGCRLYIFFYCTSKHLVEATLHTVLLHGAYFLFVIHGYHVETKPRVPVEHVRRCFETVRSDVALF